jgi:hypothetical protein
MRAHNLANAHGLIGLAKYFLGRGEETEAHIHEALRLSSPLALLPALSVPLLTTPASAQTTTSSGALPSWNEGPAKQAILDFVRDTTDRASPKFVRPEERIATFDQDGTLWVEHPVYSQMMYCLDRVPVLAEKKPELKNEEPFKTVLSGNREAIAKLPGAGPRDDHSRYAHRHDNP